MTQPKQVKTLIFSLLAIFCVMVAWLWLTRSPAVGVIPTNPVPSVSVPAPTVSTPAPTINPVSAANPAVLATPPTAATPPRFLGRPFARRHGVPAVIEDRWATAATLREVGTPVLADPDYRRRVRLVRTDFKYPLVRLEETVYLDSKSGGEVLVEQTAMVADHVLVKLAPGVDVQTLATLVTAKGGTIRSVKPAAKVYLITISAPLDLDGLPAAIDILKAASGVITIAEPDFIVHSTTTPNDASFAQLWGMHNTGQTGGVADADIDAPEAWDLTTGSRSVRVGIIDTGIDYNHPDLAANMWTNPGEIPGNGIDDDANGYVDDVRGWDFVNNDADPMDDQYHGTHCAGTIGGVGNNGTGVAGVAHQVSLIGLKFLSATGSGSLSDAIEAVAYATGLGLDLTSNSWGGGGFSQALYDVIAAANTAGHVFVAAAGNNASNTDAYLNYPSCYDLPNIISVAATDHNDQLASFSNYGTASVDLAAPGVTIYSTAPNSAYQNLSGTSMATPHVAGAAALLKAYRPSLTGADIKTALMASVDSVPALAGKTVTGGRLNIYSALLSLDSLLIAPTARWSVSAPLGGTVPSEGNTYTLRNLSAAARSWSATLDVTWAQVNIASGTIASGGSATTTVSLVQAAVQSLPAGVYQGNLRITELTSGRVHVRPLTLTLAATPVVAYSFDLSSDPGWARTGEWAWGAPSGLGGGSYGLPDPTAGYTGANVFGVNLAGDYSVATGGPYTLTAGPFNLTGYTATRLQFRRWLNSDYEPFVSAAVELSTNGTTWQQVWRNGSAPIVESAWSLQDIDLSAYADGQAAVFVRWTYTVSGYAWPLSGWNIDDIQLLGAPPRQVRFDPVAPMVENVGTASATLRLQPAPTTPLTVQFTSSMPALLPSPAAVVVPAGATSVSVPLTILDNTTLDGTRNVLLTPSASAYSPTTLALTIYDNETATLSLELPATATEGGTGTGRVLSSVTPAVPVTITLASNLTDAATVPASVILPAGTTSAEFTLSFPDNTRIEDSRTATLTAAVVGWTGAQGTLTVADNEQRTLGLSIVAGLSEGAGAVADAGTLTISGTLSTSLTVTLDSSTPVKLTVPASVVIPAGSTSVKFPVTLLDDADRDGVQTVQLTATAASFTSAQTSVAVADNDPASFSFDTIPSPQYTGQAFSVRVVAFDINGAPALGFKGTANLTGKMGATPSIVSPAQTGTFAAGAWTGGVSTTTAGSNWTLQATTGTASGTSNVFEVRASSVQVVNLATNDLIYDPGTQRLYASTPSGTIVPINPEDGAQESAISVDATATTLLARAADGSRLWVAFDTNAQIRPLSLSDRTLGASFNLGTGSFGQTRAEDIVALNGSPNSLVVARYRSGVSPRHDGVSIYDSGVRRTTSTADHTGSNSIEAGATAGRVFGYNNETTEFGSRRLQASATGITQVDVRSDLIGGFGTTIHTDGDLVAATNGRIINGETYRSLASLPYSGPVRPDASANRVYMLSDQGGGVRRLRAYDTERFSEVGSLDVSGVSGTPGRLIRWGASGLAFRTPTQVFLLSTVLVPTSDSANLQVTQLATPNPAVTGQPLNYLISVRNLGGGPAASVVLTDTLPSGSTLVEAVASQGSISSSATQVSATLGSLAAGAEATLRIQVTPSMTGTAQNVATVTAATGDPDMTNNQSVSSVTVSAPSGLALRRMAIGARDLAYDPGSDRLLVTLGTAATAFPNFLVRVNPVTTAVDSADFFGNNPGALALTDDRQFAYAVLDGSFGIGRLPVISGASSLLSFAVDQFASVYGLQRARGITVIPGRPGAIAARLKSVSSTGGHGVGLFENGVLLPKVMSGVYSSDVLVNSPTTNRIYGYCNESSGFQLTQIDVATNGLTAGAEKGGLIESGGVSKLKRAGHLIYSTNGRVIDPEALTLVANVSVYGPIEPSIDDDAFYILDGSTLRSYDLTTRVPLATLALGTLDGTPTNLVRCGGRSLAFTTTTGQLYLVDAPSVVPPPSLRVLLPARLTEGATTAPGVGRVEVLRPASADIAVQLTSSDPAVLDTTRNIILPAGQTSVTFDVSVPNNTGLNGTRSVTITPTTEAAYTPKAATILVDDDDSASLSLQLPPSVTEGAGIVTGKATLTLSAAATVPITVSLSSSATTALQVPATLTIPAGATSVNFDLTVPDDDLIDGTQSSTVTASVPNYTPGSATVQVNDNESRSLTLTLPATANEGSSYTYATLTLSGKTVAPLTVSFTTSDSTELLAPNSVTVPAGANSVPNIYCQVVDDTVPDGTQTATLTASAPSFTSGSAIISVQDNDPASAVWSTIASPQTAGTAFSATLTLKTIDGSVANYYGYVPITAVNATGAAQLNSPTYTLYVSGGVGTAPLAVLTAGTQTKLLAQVAPLPPAESNPFTVQSAGLAGFGVSNMTSPQVVGVPSTITLTAQDAYGNTVNSFNGSANLAAGTPATITGVGTSTSSSYPLFSYVMAVSRTQAIYTPTEIGGAGQLSSLALQLATAPGQEVSNWTIRLKHVSSTSSSGWEATGWTIVNQGTSDLTAAGPGWVEFPFTTPFAYDGSSNLMVDFSYSNSSYSYQPSAVVQTSYIGAPRLRYYTSPYNSYGDPLLWSGTTQYSYIDYSVPNLRLNRTASVSVNPASAGTFASGVWTGPVTFSAASATPVTLQVRQGTAFGQSNSFTIQAPPSFSLTPVDAFTLSGSRGTDFSTQSRTYTLTNTSAASIAWTATNPATWLTLSTLDGTLAAGASTTIKITPTAAASALASGTYTADVAFSIGGVVQTTRRIELIATAYGELALTPATDFSPTGLVGGPFTPAAATWTLSNPGDAAVTWTAIKTQPWLMLSSSGGTLAPGATATVTASLATAANTLPVAVYADTITIANATNGRGTTSRDASLTVRAPAPPIITIQPAATSVVPTKNAVLQVAATSIGTLTYQWYRGNSGDTASPVAGASGALLVTPPLATTAKFWVRVSNDEGFVDSLAATATVKQAANLSLWAMGYNGSGAFGNGSYDDRNTPTQLASGVAQLAASYGYTLFIKTDGSLWATGDNFYGQHGDGSNMSRNTPARVATGVTQVSVGYGHALFIKTDGSLWATGFNDCGQLGDGSNDNRNTPAQVATGVAQVYACYAHTLFIKTDGTLWATGYNNHGQLGDGSNDNRNTPAQVATGVAQVTGGEEHTLFIKTDGTLWATGNNAYGQLGGGTSGVRNTPTQVATGVAQVTAGVVHTLFIKTDGTLWAAGFNNYGQLGDGSNGTRNTPVQVATGVAQVTTVNNHTLFTKMDGSLWATGYNARGQLGDGSNVDKSTPVQVAMGVMDFSVGGLHSLFLQSPPPIILTHPASGSVSLGQTRALSVAVDSPLAVTYQWYQGASGDTSVPIEGAIAAAFTTAPVVSPASYWVRVTNVVGSTDSQTAALTVAPPPDTDSDGMPDTWETAHGLDPASSAGSNGKLGDPDSDGLTNLLEYAFGLDPQQADTASPYSVQTGTDPSTGQAELRFTYRRLLAPAVLKYSLLTSSDLLTWQKPVPQPAELSATPNPDGTTATVIARLPVVGPRLFVRIQIESP